MKTVFFAARKLHRDYFAQLAARIPESQVLYYKKLLLPALTTVPSEPLNGIVELLIQEKSNSPRGRTRTPRYWQRFRRLKQREAAWLYRVYYRALKQSGADKLVLWNGLKYRQMLVVAAAEALGLKILYMENGLLPGRTTLDPRGINFLNSVPRDGDFFRNYQATAVVDTDTGQQTERPETLPEHYLLVPFQVNTDSQIIRFSPWIRHMQALVENLVSAAETLGGRAPVLIFKPHPACPQDYSDLIDRYSSERIHFLTDNSVSTATLIRHADAVITINSTVGIEALLQHKRVIVLGQAFYNIPGLTLAAGDRQGLTEALQQLPHWQPDTGILQGFFAYLADEYQLPGRWQEADENHLAVTAQRIGAL